MPAISATFTIQNRKASYFSELLQIGWDPEKEIADLQLSAHVGRLKVIATPWFFSVAKIGANIAKSVMSEFGLDGVSSPRSIIAMRKSCCSRCTVEKVQNLVIEVRMDNPHLFLVEDTSDPASASMLLSFSTDMWVHISPLFNIDVSLSLISVRGCRGDPRQEELPQPDMADFIYPCDLILNAHFVKTSRKLSGTFVTSERIIVRLSVLDSHLIMNAFHRLKEAITAANYNDHEQEKEQADPSGNAALRREQENGKDASFLEGCDSVAESPLSDFSYDPESYYESPLMVSPCSALSAESDSAVEPFFDFWTYHSQFFVNFNRIMVVLVNDSLDTHIPVASLSLTNMTIRLGVTSGRLNVNLQMDWEAESYNPRSTAWEPLLEPWSMNVAVEVEKHATVGIVIELSECRIRQRRIVSGIRITIHMWCSSRSKL